MWAEVRARVCGTGEFLVSGDEGNEWLGPGDDEEAAKAWW